MNPSENARPARPSPRFHGSTFGRWRRRFLGTVCLTAYVFCVSLFCAGLGAHVVSADLQEGTIQLGASSRRSLTWLGRRRRFSLNGTTMNARPRSPPSRRRRSSTASRRSVVSTRSFSPAPSPTSRRRSATRQCRPRRRRTSASCAQRRTATAPSPASSMTAPPRRGTFPPGSRPSPRRGDLSELGRFRYVYAGSLKSGKTSVRTVWADGSFKLKEMFPANGDAAGFDSSAVPRPPGSRRIYHRHLGGRSLRSPHLRCAGGQGLAPPLLRRPDDLPRLDARGGQRGVDDTVVYTQDVGHAVYVSFENKGCRTLVTTTETARPGDPAEAVVEIHN